MPYRRAYDLVLEFFHELSGPNNSPEEDAKLQDMVVWLDTFKLS